MNEVEFRNWMINNGINRKVACDTISRLKRIERELNHCDIDEHYRSDKCEYLMSLFLKSRKISAMKKYPNANLPFGEYRMSIFRYALNQYVKFCDEEITLNIQ
jgi:hypothetical protein